MNMYEVLEYLCSKKNVKITNVEKELGFSKGSLSKLKKGKPTASRAFILADYFGVDASVILDAEKYETTKDLDERLNAYRLFLEKNKPIYKVAAGEGAYNEQIPTDYEDMDDNYSDEYSWCEIVGDSMFPELKDGDRVKVHHQTETEKTDLTVVKVDGEHATVKFVEIVENGVWLRAINKDVYDDRFYTIKDVVQLPITIVGKVVEVRRKY